MMSVVEKDLESYLAVSNAFQGFAKMTTGTAIDKLKPITYQKGSSVLASRASNLLEKIIRGRNSH